MKTSMVLTSAGTELLSTADAPKTPRGELENDVLYREAGGVMDVGSDRDASNLSNAVRMVAKLCEQPGVPHRKAALKILQYVRSAARAGIVYGGRGSGTQRPTLIRRPMRIRSLR